MNLTEQLSDKFDSVFFLIIVIVTLCLLLCLSCHCVIVGKYFDSLVVKNQILLDANALEDVFFNSSRRK